jgi:hypothetical protein
MMNPSQTVPLLSPVATLPQSASAARRPVAGLGARGHILHMAALGLFVAVCIVGAAGHAATRPLWSDELLTVYISRLDSVRTMWSALEAGVDLNPPLVHMMTRAALAAGDSALTARLPSLLGVAVALLAIFAAAAWRHGPRVGWLAAALFVWTHAATYAYEARPYGLVLAFSALAYVCWQRAPRHPGWVVGLALALAAATSSHYYTVLVFVPLAAGEIVRTWERRRIAIGVWIAFGVSTLPLLAWIPLIRTAQEFSAHYWARPSVAATSNTFVTLLSGVTLPALAAVAAAALSFAWYRRTDRGAALLEDDRAEVPASDWTVALLLAALPVLAFALAQITNAYTNRYVLPATIGWCVLCARIPSHLARTVSTRRAVAAATVAVILLTAARQLVDARLITLATPTVPLLARLHGLPAEPHRIVITEAVLYLQFAHYASAELRDRMLFAEMPERALAITGTNTGTDNIRRLGKFTEVQTEDFDSVVAAREPMYVYGRDGWVMTLLRDSGASMRLLAQDGNRVLLHVTWPEPFPSGQTLSSR